MMIMMMVMVMVMVMVMHRLAENVFLNFIIRGFP
jgi:hypothetical protein